MALTFKSDNTNKLEGSAAGGAYGNFGVGNNSMSYREATRKGSGGGTPGSMRSQGETAGVGSTYSVALNERPNLSNPRNRGPERAPSRSGATAIPMVTQSQRNTGRISG